MARLWLIFFVAPILTACASFDVNQVQAAMNRHDCQAAEAIVMPAARAGEKEALNNLGVIYTDCYHDRQKGIAYYTLAARKGEENARMNLANMGQPIPPADLVAQSSDSNFLNALMLVQATTPRPQVPPQMPSNNINCTSNNLGNGVVTTNCH
jgi:TPR repeat protein